MKKNIKCYFLIFFFHFRTKKKELDFFLFCGRGVYGMIPALLFPPGDSQTTCIHFDGLMHLSVFSSKGWRRDYPGELEKTGV